MFPVHVVVEGDTVWGSVGPRWSSRCRHVVQWREQTSSIPGLTGPRRLNVHVETFIVEGKYKTTGFFKEGRSK